LRNLESPFALTLVSAGLGFIGLTSLIGVTSGQLDAATYRHSAAGLILVMVPLPSLSPWQVLRAVFFIGITAGLLRLFYSGLREGRKVFKVALGSVISVLSVMVLGTSKTLATLDPKWSSYFVYSSFVSLLHISPGHVNPSTGLYSGLWAFDVEALALVVAAALLTFVLYRSEGILYASLKSIGLVGLIGVLLGSAVYSFDYSEFNLHVISVQAASGIGTWFTNADLLFACSGLLALSAFPSLAKHDTVSGG
jgi:hypothetical protein